jgi:hypothetical protein
MTDTGPPYPRPVPGSANGIGTFQIGISPIGVMPAFDAWTTVISQYANSPILDAMITSFKAPIKRKTCVSNNTSRYAVD